MKVISIFIIYLFLISCNTARQEKNNSTIPLIGSWKLISGTLIEKGDTVITDYTKDISFIKIINESHFAFVQHDLNKGKDSTSVFSAGAGTYDLVGDQYTEHLEYCNAREWEMNDFKFTLSMHQDTLIQSGKEIVESEGIERYNIEVYKRIKK